MSTTNNSREFVFVEYSGRSRSCSKLVKQHVMHDYIEKRRKSSRRPDTTRQRPKVRSYGKPCLQAEVCSLLPKVNESKPRSGRKKRLGDEDDMPLTSTHNLAQLQFFKNHWKLNVDPSPGSYRLDPFNVLSVKDVPNDLIYWHFAMHTCYRQVAPWIYQVQIHWVQRAWRNSIADESLLYVQLCQAEKARVAVTRSTDLTRYLSLQVRALGALRRRIVSEGDKASDALILLITSQISLSIIDGDYETSQAHLEAAAKLIAQRKQKLDGLAMAHYPKMDAKHAAINLTRPMVEIHEVFPPLQAPPALQTLIGLKTLGSARSLPRDFPSHPEILYSLHLVAHAYEERVAVPSPENCHIFMTYVKTLHHLSNLAAEVCEEQLDGNTKPRMSSSSAALILCFEFFGWEHDSGKFIWLDHPLYMRRLCSRLLPELQSFLQIGNTSLSKRWTATGASMTSLLWTLFMGTTMACIGESHGSESPYDAPRLFIDAIQDVAYEMDIQDMATFEEALKQLPWTDEFCSMWSHLIGAQLGLRGAEGAGEWPPYSLNSCCHGACEKHAVHFQVEPFYIGCPADCILS